MYRLTSHCKLKFRSSHDVPFFFFCLQHEGKKKWYDFDDRCVQGLEKEDNIKTSAAYVLFYRRVKGGSSLDTETTTIESDCTR
jgi:hypothetical protein